MRRLLVVAATALTIAIPGTAALLEVISSLERPTCIVTHFCNI
jgi:hypothetical protein